MTQCEKLLDYMQSHGSITGMDSINMGVLNYKGHINASGEKKTYARYYLEGSNGRTN